MKFIRKQGRPLLNEIRRNAVFPVANAAKDYKYITLSNGLPLLHSVTK